MSNSARQTAFKILLKIERDKAYSNIALDSAVKASNLNSTDCAFISNIVYGVTERKITLDYEIVKYLNSPLKKLKPDVLVALRMGAYQLLFMDKIPESAAVNESVKLVKANGSGYSAGLVNAVLRKLAENGLNLPPNDGSADNLSVIYSVPKELVNLITYHYGAENASKFFSAALSKQKLTIRVNTLKITSDELIEVLKKENVAAEKTTCENALIINTVGAVYLLEAYKKGFFHVEDISSQLCVAVLGAKKGETVIDVCSAPGGKSFTIGEMMENEGTLYSCDLYEARTNLIKTGAERLGIDIIKTCVNDASMFNKDFPKADRVLCDVPCSGLGIIGKKPEIKYKELDDIKELIPIQKKILNTSAEYVKDGGTLVYSTCSVNPNENKKVCDAFLKEHPEFCSVPVLPSVLRVKDEGDYITFMPHINNCDGFFTAKFIKRNDKEFYGKD